jgi:hypothetical protein
MTTQDLFRGLSQDFERALLSGVLKPILERVCNDDTLSLEVRNGYVDIYYRGGRLLGLHGQSNDTKFSTVFDERYFDGGKDDHKSERPDKQPPRMIQSIDDTREWVRAFALYKQAMDIRFSLHPKIEREYQQAVVRDNNRHWSGDASDYVVVDIEYAQSPRIDADQECNYRFDMVGFRWPSEGKTRSSGLVTPVIMEMKVGDAVLASPLVKPGTDELMPGLKKHVLDFERFLTPKNGETVSRPYQQLCQELVSIFNTKQRLGLPSLPKRMRDLRIEIGDVAERPEVLFVLANHQPSSTILHRELTNLPERTRAEYRIASVTYAGYALFADNLLTVDEAIKDTEPKR